MEKILQQTLDQQIFVSKMPVSRCSGKRGGKAKNAVKTVL
jgi:hypothetical protein